MSSESAPTTKEELRDALDELVLSAYEVGVDVGNGGYALNHNSAAIPDWDVHITRVEK
jgi:hypothetical protein